MKKNHFFNIFLLIINSLITLFHLTSVQEFSIFYLNQVDKKSEYHQYNSDKTEITKLGFYKNENTQKITIRPIPYFVKKVPETLPAEIQSLYLAFAHRYERHGEVTGFEKWDTKNIEDMSYAFFENHTVDSDISFWNTDKVTNMKSMFKNAVKFNNNGKSLKNWNTNLVTSMESMFEGAEKFNQNLRSWKVEKVKDNKNFSRGSGFSNDPNKRPDWKTPEVNDPVEKKPKEIQPKEIIHSPLVKPKVNIPWTRIVTPATKYSPALKPTPDSKKGLEIPKANLSTTNQQSKKLSTPAIVGIVVGSQVVLTSLAVGTPYLIKKFKK
ncbi:hypothetical protein BVA24_00700 [Mycoplasma capricolum subsp. capripneumoniae]|nr:hypothetical protein BVA24_00700 [Mycoplasma capricolum subsp. capripneumoniae]